MGNTNCTTGTKDVDSVADGTDFTNSAAAAGVNISKTAALAGGAVGAATAGVSLVLTGGVAAPVWLGAAAVASGGATAAAAGVAAGWTFAAGAWIVGSAAAGGAFVCAFIGSLVPVHSPIAEIQATIKELKQKEDEKGLQAALEEQESILAEWPIPRGEDGKAIDLKLINIAIMGQSGTGKSSLVNHLVGRRVAEVGRKAETTTVMQPYDWKIRRLLKCKLWDVPGGGTEKFPAQEYVKKMGLRYFDALLILTGDRFTEVDSSLFKEARKWGIPTYLVQTRMDEIIQRGQFQDPNARPQEIIDETKKDFQKIVGLDFADRVFLISVIVNCKHFKEFLKPEISRLKDMLRSELVSTRRMGFTGFQRKTPVDQSTSDECHQADDDGDLSDIDCSGLPSILEISKSLDKQKNDLTAMMAKVSGDSVDSSEETSGATSFSCASQSLGTRAEMQEQLEQIEIIEAELGAAERWLSEMPANKPTNMADTFSSSSSEPYIAARSCSNLSSDAQNALATIRKYRTVNIISTPYGGDGEPLAKQAGAKKAQATKDENTNEFTSTYTFDPNSDLVKFSTGIGFTKEEQAKRWMYMWTLVLQIVKEKRDQGGKVFVMKHSSDQRGVDGILGDAQLGEIEMAKSAGFSKEAGNLIYIDFSE